MKSLKKFSPSDILIGVVFTLFFLSLGVILVVNFRPLYYLDINLLDIPEQTGLSSTVIKDNYDALIDYNSPFFHGDLRFPSLPSSEHGLVHFKEVKNIFMSFYLMLPISILILVGIIGYKHKRKNYSYLEISSLTMIILPFIVGIGAFLNFDKLFVAFHKLFFRNDYWLFDPELDPIINLLPDTFFMHSALLIAFILLLGSGILFLLSRLFKKKYSR
jgi:integral membrane protein (TIGR01906 family)